MEGCCDETISTNIEMGVCCNAADGRKNEMEGCCDETISTNIEMGGCCNDT